MKVAPSSILITGANRGIGLELVRQLIALPTPPKHLFATCRNPEKAKELQGAASSNECLKILKVDVLDQSAMDRLCKAIESVVKGDGLNMLINNAGVNKKMMLNEVTEDKLIDTIRVNTISPLLLTKTLLPLLQCAARKHEGAALSYRRAMVVNVSSKLGSISDNHTSDRYGRYDYRSSKAALNMVSSILARDLKPEGILVMPVHPGSVPTDMGNAHSSLTKEESISGMLKLFAEASEEHAGQLYDYQGNHINW